MAHRSQCSSAGDNPLDPNYLPPHYREEYRLAIDTLVEDNLEGYYEFLQQADVVNFLSTPEINYIQCTVQPPKESKHPDQRFLESGGDGSSDTYWPIHSDLDAPGLDLGWPQLHRFIGPTEVTTLVNPAEPNMPTIKEQARRLIKNAQEVIAIVMDMFTDVDIFADILNAAMRNVAVYILLDEQNAHHFIDMVCNCRVDLETIQFLRVRTVSGITYHCRSGNSFKGQMMDRFLLTDCRAVLSGNYSFMWSFEKIHRCLAHLFLGQLVSTFDEEFRILFAQSQPLIIENALAQMEDFSQLSERHYACDRTPLYRVPRKFPTIDNSRSEEWARHSMDERMDKDWKNRIRHESMHRSLDQGPVDMYNKFPSKQLHMDPSYEQGHSRMPINIMENPAFKRHSYAEGGRRHSYQFLQQQEMPNFETHGRQLYKGMQPYLRTGLEGDYSGYDKVRDHGYHQVDQYSEPGLPQELEPPDNFDPVLNYLSSTSNVDFDQVSDKLLPAAEGPFGSSYPKKLSLGKTYVCQTSPTTPNPPDWKQFFQEPDIDRKDPTVKQGLRNWRINSYLTAFDNAGDEDMPLTHGTDPFEESPYSLQQTATVCSVPKFHNTREFKIPATPRASQLPNYTKPSVPEPSKTLSDDSVNMTAENKTPTTPSESSSTTEGHRIEEVEPKSTGVQREESFRRKYNAALQRSSRLRSSLIFSSQLEQQDPQTAPGNEETDKNEDDLRNLPIASQVLRQRRAIAREPFEWSRYVRSATFDNSTTETSKADDVDNKVGVKDSSKEKMSDDLPENNNTKESCKLTEIESAKLSPSMPQPKPSQVELPKLNQPVHPSTSLLSNPSHIDMSDPDNRLMFFKELAANRKAAKAAADEKSREECLKKPPSELKNTTLKMKEPVVEEVSQNLADSSLKKPTTLCETLSERYVAQDAENIISTEVCGSDSLLLDINDKTNKQGNHPRSHSDTSHSCEEEPTRVSTHAEKTVPKISPASVSMSVSAGSALSPSQPPEEPKLSNPTVKECSPSQPLTVPDTDSTVPSLIDSLAQSTDKHESPLDSTTTVSNSLNPSLVELPPSSKSVTLESIQHLGLPQLQSSSSSPPTPSESSSFPHPIGSEFIFSHPSAPSSSSDHILSDRSSSQDIQFHSSPSPSSSAPHSSPLELISSNISPEDSSSTPACNILSPKSDKTEPNKSLNPSPSESSQSTNQTSQESTLLPSSITQTVLSPHSTQVKPDSITQSTSSETSSTIDSTIDISSDTCANDSELNTSSQSTTKAYCEDRCTLKLGSEKDLPASESNSVPKSDSVETVVSSSVVLASPEDVKVKCNLSPSHSSSVSLLTDSCLPFVSGLESSNSLPKPDQKDSPKLTPAEPPPEHAPTETGAVLNPAIHSDFPPNASPPEPNASCKVALTQATSSSELTPTGSSTPSPATTASCSVPRADTDGSTNTSPTLSPPETSSSLQLASTDSSKCPISPSTESSSDRNLTEPTSKVIPVPTELELPYKTSTESKSIASESYPSEPSVPVESNTDKQCEVSKESEMPDSAGKKKTGDGEATKKVNKTTPQESVSHGKPSDQVRENNSSETAEIRERETSDEVVPLTPQSKQSKTSHSRYHSSTANVISSSNLRDDTKLLLEQISANSQSRSEPTKESAVTDDDKEDKAEKEAATRSLSKGQTKNTEEREKLLEKIQSMRKERKVYSRFEMAP